MLEVEGNEIQETLEPETNLNHHVLWDKRDIYGQKVYGRYVYVVDIYVFKDINVKSIHLSATNLFELTITLDHEQY